MSRKGFWGLTLREYEARRVLWESGRRHLDIRFAELRADLFNAWGRGPDTPARSAKDYLPDGKQKTQAETAEDFIRSLNTQTVDERKFALRTMIAEACDTVAAMNGQ